MIGWIQFDWKKKKNSKIEDVNLKEIEMNIGNSDADFKRIIRDKIKLILEKEKMNNYLVMKKLILDLRSLIISRDFINSQYLEEFMKLNPDNENNLNSIINLLKESLNKDF